MTTDRERRANRANAKSSTGPKTASGKTRSAQNALRHGLNVSTLSDPALAPLAEAMAAGDLAEYDRAHPRLALKAHVMARMMLLLDRGAAARRLGLSAMQMQPWIFRRLLAVHVG